MTAILGISAFYHDSAAALVVDGRIVAAAQEERFSRRKHDYRFPQQAIEYCLQEAGISATELDLVGFYDKPLLKFDRLLETYLAYAPRGFRSFLQALPLWVKQKLHLPREIRRGLNGDYSRKIVFTEHHESHAASAFFPSPFEEAAIVTLDGVGEWATASIGHGQGHQIELTHEMHFPHSVGLLYSAFTYYCGFRVNSGEYKLMGLAPYGEPRYADLILDHLLDLREDGSFQLDMSYFNYCQGLTMTSRRFHDLFGGPPRKAEGALTDREMDIAASIQQVTEEIMLRTIRTAHRQGKSDNLCLAGGVALNCVGNGRILRESPFENIWIQPAAGDAGGSLGAALGLWHIELKKNRTINNKDSMNGSYLGPEYSQDEVEKKLKELGANFEVLDNEQLIEKTALELSNGKAVGWFQGRMEFGPRALGCRSILGDARSENMQKTLNLKVKYRESFRPFAPSVIREDLPTWFDLDCDSPYMLLVSGVANEKRRIMTEEEKAFFGIDKLNVKRSDIPAVTHVDYSARVQTVHKETNPKYYKLISEFKKKTGCPVIVNTSFNVRGEPIVNTPENAFKCFMGTEIDILVIENCFLRKEKQKKSLKTDYKNKYELD